MHNREAPTPEGELGNKLIEDVYAIDCLQRLHTDLEKLRDEAEQRAGSLRQQLDRVVADARTAQERMDSVKATIHRLQEKKNG